MGSGPRREKLVVGLGGTLRSPSSTENVVRGVLERAIALGAETRMFSGPALRLPMYEPGAPDSHAATELISALRAASGVVIGTPGYHGGVSGLVKNALDYVEDMAGDPEPYLSGRAVVCVCTGSGWQGANSGLHALRNIVHALRGWPTPLGIAANSREPLFDADGTCMSEALADQMSTAAAELMAFGLAR